MIDNNGKQEQATRLRYIDCAKGIAIILVIIGHCIGKIQYQTDSSLDNKIEDLINSFHMPLFFVIGGITHRNKQLKDLLHLRFKSLIIPWFGWIAINFCLGFALKGLRHCQIIDKQLFDDFVYIFKFRGIWFIQSYFIVCLLYNTVDQQIKKKAALLCLMAFSLGFGLYISQSHKDILPAYCIQAMVGVFFYFYGTILRSTIEKWNFTRTTTLIIGIVFFIICAMLAFTTENNPLMYDNNYNNIWIFIITALLGSTGLIMISKGINHSRILEAFGRKSLIIMGVQFSVYLFAAWTLERVGFNYYEFPGNIFYILVSIGGSYFVGSAIFTCFPVLAGRNSKQRLSYVSSKSTKI